MSFRDEKELFKEPPFYNDPIENHTLNVLIT